MFLCASYMRMLIVKAEPGVSELRLCTALGRWTEGGPHPIADPPPPAMYCLNVPTVHVLRRTITGSHASSSPCQPTGPRR